jgi:RimJ/RimL family protein N-acetyltransferase
MKPTLRTARLVLRPLTLDDAAALANIFGDPRRPDYLGARITVPEAHRKRIAELHADGYLDDPLGSWAVETEDGRQVVGVALLKPLDEGPEIEVGWHFDPDAWGSGFATESARRLLVYGFDDLGLDRIVAVIDPRNGASRRVAERLKMRPDGTGHYYGHDLDRFVIDAGPV